PQLGAPGTPFDIDADPNILNTLGARILGPLCSECPDVRRTMDELAPPSGARHIGVECLQAVTVDVVLDARRY
ncbi:hypothetical protein E4U52_007968, partial [Claviceps spartinae]